MTRYAQWWGALCAVAALAITLAAPAHAQITLSLDPASPATTVQPAGADAGDLIEIGSGYPTVAYAVLQGQGLGFSPAIASSLNVNALSIGLDPVLPQSSLALWYFSVGRGASGAALSLLQFQAMSGPGQVEADIYAASPTFPPEWPINVLVHDGDGADWSAGLGLTEGAAGDNIDALEYSGPPVSSANPTYFSVDAASAAAITADTSVSITAADVLVTMSAGQSPTWSVYATAAALGLSANDDLDALVLAENGVAGYQASQSAYDWLSGSSDMLLFSVTPDSDLIGDIDAILGLAIQAGDILTPTAAGVGILVRAEDLGLFVDRATNLSDDLDGLDLDIVPEPTVAALLLPLAAFLIPRRNRPTAVKSA